MREVRRKYDKEFQEGAVRIVRETGKSIAAVARDMDINPGTLGNFYNNRRRHSVCGSKSPVDYENAWANQAPAA